MSLLARFRRAATGAASLNTLAQVMPKPPIPNEVYEGNTRYVRCFDGYVPTDKDADHVIRVVADDGRAIYYKRDN